ncbi:MAG: glycoside hydrolase family 3 C-terminal domain-containing protein [Clostridia bacterium]|nr:glycoside hydrolase family 3 C-terminal domain-containing protein [Clostridia bacterium]
MTSKERAKALVAQMTLPEKLSQLTHEAAAVERLGVPEYNWWNEALHGYARSGVATIFPQAIGMAASFDKVLMKKVADAISTEARAKYNEYKKFGRTRIYQGLTCWSPNINIFRDPRWGRGHETYGEDPYLTAEMGVAFVEGMQYGFEENPKYRKVDATLKHYAAHSGPEKGRHAFDSIVNEKDLRETYLAAFKYVIEKARPAAVMGAYNRVNGEPACGSKRLLQDILYGEWAFDGYVVSDCGAICDINAFHKLTKNEAESAALAVNNGCYMNCGSAFKYLKVAVAEGLVSEETITKACEKLFEARFDLGMFDETEYDSIPYSKVDCPEHRQLALEMSRSCTVLLKNNGILPLKQDDNIKNIAVIGPNADALTVLLGNYNGTPSEYTTPLYGIRNAAKKYGKEVRYALGSRHTNDGGDHGSIEEALIAAKYADVVVLCLGLNPQLEGEEGDAYNSDLGGDKPGLALPKPQLDLFNMIKAVGKPVIVVNVSGSAIDLRFADEQADAVLQCFYPGQDGGKALAEIIFGEVEPTAKLPVTFYASDDQLPEYTDYSLKGRTYRYMTEKPLYPFGYGIGYNKYEISNVSCDAVVGVNGATVTCDIKNLGKRDGGEVVQVYIGHKNKPEAPIYQLIAFDKVWLKAGEKKSVTFDIPVDRFMLYNNDGDLLLEDSDAVIYVGTCSPVKDELCKTVDISIRS